MNTDQIPHTASDLLSRCEVSSFLTESGQALDKESIQADAALAHEVDQALWKNEVLRAMDYYEVDVRVKNRIVFLSGHVVSSTSNNLIEKAISVIPGIVEVRNDLVLDDKLTTEVASALGNLEHIYNCKFFTGVSHGVVALHGNVDTENIKSLAEKSVASHPNVRGVINCVRVRGNLSELLDTPIYQPAIGQEILFLNGVSGNVRQVVINPHNRRVVALTLAGSFTDQKLEFQSMSNNQARPPERLIVISATFIRYLTKFSGYLTINSDETNHYADFDPALFQSPPAAWVPPYPYCPQDVLFPAEEQTLDQQALGIPLESWLVVNLKETLDDRMITNDSLGG